MAHDLTETAAFAPNVTVPDPGDARTAASVETFAQQLANRTKYTYEGARTGQWDAMRFGAVGDASTDDTAALAAGIAACAAAGGGDFCISKPHRITDELSIPSSVNLIGMNHAAALLIDHATKKTLKFVSGSYILSPSRIEGITFGALQNNSGAMLYNDAATAARLVVRDCFFGLDNKSQGKAVDFAGSSHLELLGNHFNVFGGGYISFTGNFSELVIRGGTFKLPASAYVSTLIGTNASNTRVSVTDVFFNGEAVTAGGSPIVFSCGGGFLTYSGCHFKGSVSANMLVLTTGGFTGLTVVEGANTYSVTTDPYPAGGQFADGSSLLVPRKWVRVTDIGPTYTGWANDIETLELTGGSTTPTITLPDPMYNGRRIRLVIRNVSGSTWGSIAFSPSAPLLTAIPGVTLAHNQSAAFDFQVLQVAAGSPLTWTVTHQGP